jgi:hypothetical protein
MSAREIAVIAIPVVGAPLLIVLAPRLFGLTRIVRGHALGGLLIVNAVWALAFEPVSAFQELRRFLDIDVSPGMWLNLGAHSAILLTSAVLMLVAGVRMARGLPARPLLGAYLIVALVLRSAVDLVGIAQETLGAHDHFYRFAIVDDVVFLIISFIKPLLIWHFAKQEPEPEQNRATRIDAALPWLALWFVAPLAAVCVQVGAQDGPLHSVERVILVSCALQAVACLVAALKTLRGERSFGAWCVGAAIASLLATLAVYRILSMHGQEHGEALIKSQLAWQAFLLVSTMATGAWFANRSDHSSRGGDGQP